MGISCTIHCEPGNIIITQSGGNIHHVQCAFHLPLEPSCDEISHVSLMHLLANIMVIYAGVHHVQNINKAQILLLLVLPVDLCHKSLFFSNICNCEDSTTFLEYIHHENKVTGAEYNF
jgi:hypothetical protein